MIVVEAVMMMEVIGIVGIGLDDGRWMIGLDDGWMHHSFHHSRQHHGLDDVMRHTVHHRGALVRHGRRHMHDLGHMQRLDVVVRGIQRILRIMVVVAMQVARTGSGQGAQRKHRKQLERITRVNLLGYSIIRSSPLPI